VLDIKNEASDGAITAWCPFHDDGAGGHDPPHRPNLSIKAPDDTGRQMWNCFACHKKGGSLHQLADCLWDIGLLEPDGHYDYVDEAGKLQYQIIRWPDKQFHARRPGSKRGWHWNMDGVFYVPYRLPELMAADRAEAVFITEGEGDADTAAASLGVTATTNPFGAGKWREEFSPHFVDRHVVIIPDNDGAGLTHAQDVVAKLLSAPAEYRPASVRILRLPGLPEKGDVSDWIAAGGTKEQLLALAEKTPMVEPPSAEPPATAGLPFRTATEIRSNPRPKPAVLVEGLLHLGEIGIETGPFDSLKSRFGAELARALVTGEPFLDRFPIAKSGPVLLIQVEIHPGFYDERIIALTVGLLEKHTDRLLVVSGEPFRLEQPYTDQLEQMVSEHGVIAIVLDPAGEMWPQSDFDENSSTDMNRLFQVLKGIRDRHTVAIILILHDPKDELRRARGSSVLQNAPDVRIYLTGLTCPDGKVRSRVTMRLRNMPRPAPFNILCLDNGRLTVDDTVVTTAVQSSEQNQVLLGMEELGRRVTVAEVAEHIHKEANATRNILNRLVEAEWLGVDKRCKPHEYWPLTETEREAANAQTQTLLEGPVCPFGSNPNTEDQDLEGEPLP
jgi:hypothetical protein